MPVFVSPDVRDRWLDPQRFDASDERDGMVALLEQSGERMAAEMTTYEVDRRVNNTRTADLTDAGLIVPLER